MMGFRSAHSASFVNMRPPIHLSIVHSNTRLGWLLAQLDGGENENVILVLKRDAYPKLNEWFAFANKDPESSSCVCLFTAL